VPVATGSAEAGTKGQLLTPCGLCTWESKLLHPTKTSAVSECKYCVIGVCWGRLGHQPSLDSWREFCESRMWVREPLPARENR